MHKIVSTLITRPSPVTLFVTSAFNIFLMVVDIVFECRLERTDQRNCIRINILQFVMLGIKEE